MGIKQSPSSARLRQRFDEDARALIPLLDEASVEFLCNASVPGDRIIGVDGKVTDDVAKLLARLDDRKVGDVVVLSVERAGKSREVQVELQPGI